MNERTNERKNEQTQHPKRSLRWFIIVELTSGYCCGWFTSYKGYNYLTIGALNRIIQSLYERLSIDIN